MIMFVLQIDLLPAITKIEYVDGNKLHESIITKQEIKMFNFCIVVPGWCPFHRCQVLI